MVSAALIFNQNITKSFQRIELFRLGVSLVLAVILFRSSGFESGTYVMFYLVMAMALQFKLTARKAASVA
jgi:hypothetical protein